MSSCATSSGIALDHAVMTYDRTTVDVVSKLLLLNIARAHRDQPMHFTTVSSIAATYAFTFQAGVGPALTGDLGWLPMPSIGGSTTENPTITITPMQGDEFTQRLLTPFEERKVTMLLRQGYDVDALLRLMAGEWRSGDLLALNRPADKEGYAAFRRVAAHLSTIQDRHALHVGSVQLMRDGARVKGRTVITNYDLNRLSNDERQKLNDEANEGLESDILVDIRENATGGELPMHGTLRLRSFFNVLTFIGRDIAAEREYDVAPDPRTPPLQENPAHALEIVENGDGDELSVALAGKTYALRKDSGYAWNKKAFSMLYQLFQMSVSPSAPNAPMITIAK